MQNNQKKIVLIGGPGTGKSTVLNSLKREGFFCFDEISREVTLQAQKDGINQLFLENPLLFSDLLLKGREMQFKKALDSNADVIFFDRGIPDVHAYMDYIKTDYPNYFVEKCKDYNYDYVFHFTPWKDIYVSDNERYESFEESLIIDQFLTNAYTNLGYHLIKVPFGKVQERVNFIKDSLSLL